MEQAYTISAQEPSSRIGCDEHGARAVLQHAFFAGLPVGMLEDGSLTPPFKPGQIRNARVLDF